MIMPGENVLVSDPGEQREPDSGDDGYGQEGVGRPRQGEPCPRSHPPQQVCGYVTSIPPQPPTLPSPTSYFSRHVELSL